MSDTSTVSKSARPARRILVEKVFSSRLNKGIGIAITIAVMAGLCFIVNVFNVPNPNMILVMGVVVCTSIFGYIGGIPALVIMMLYTLFFFSTNHDFITFTDQNMQKVVVTAIGVTVITFFVSGLRHIVTSSYVELAQLNEVLEEDNRLLEVATAVDSLTGTRNRFGLRRDFPQYLDQDLYVTMIDIDNFKEANDLHGHQEGDRVLREMGQSLCAICGQEHAYRYGGDEFLVICPGSDAEAFSEKIEQLNNQVSALRIGDKDEPVHFSAGYTYGMPKIESDLRLMIRQADANLYESKNAGKNHATGDAFSRAKARSFPQMSGATGRITDRAQ